MVARPMSRDGVPPIRSRVEKEKPRQLGALASPGDQHPFLDLLRQEPDVEMGLTVGAKIGHLGQLGVADRRCVLGLHLDRHVRLRTPRSPERHSRRPPFRCARPVRPGHTARGVRGPQEPSPDFTGFLGPCRIRQAQDQATRSSSAERGDLGARESTEARSRCRTPNSGLDGVRAEQYPQLADQAPRARDVELGRKAQHLLSDSKKDRRVAGMLGEEPLEALHRAVGEGRDGK